MSVNKGYYVIEFWATHVFGITYAADLLYVVNITSLCYDAVDGVRSQRSRLLRKYRLGVLRIGRNTR